ncbi:MAG: RluA family pseudouridine synthase [Erysipelotrichaceae bacterium]|nr:RluA family pseudouridine synthase [Erysipelotrichaceae bacterium]
MKEIEIRENDANQRLDKFLQKTFPRLSASMMYKAIRNKKIKVNRKRCTHNQILQQGDILLLFLPPDVLEEKTIAVSDSNKPLDIVYEDENVLVVFKPAGLLSQSEKKGQQDTLIGRIWSYLDRKNELDRTAYSFRPALCQRLDRNTEGLILAAKKAEALRTINEAIAERTIRKYYLARAQGHFDTLAFDLHQYMKKEGTQALVSPQPKEGYKKTAMHIKVLQETKEETLVEIELMTGRFHQIRAGLAAIGHPLVGDRKYGYAGRAKRYQLTAYKLDCSQLPLPMKQKVFE